jgi:hypothetical protein
MPYSFQNGNQRPKMLFKLSILVLFPNLFRFQGFLDCPNLFSNQHFGFLPTSINFKLKLQAQTASRHIGLTPFSKKKKNFVKSGPNDVLFGPLYFYQNPIHFRPLEFIVCVISCLVYVSKANRCCRFLRSSAGFAQRKDPRSSSSCPLHYS